MAKPPKRRLRVGGKVKGQLDPALAELDQPSLEPGIKERVFTPAVAWDGNTTMPDMYRDVVSVIDLAPIMRIEVTQTFDALNLEQGTMVVQFLNEPTPAMTTMMDMLLHGRVDAFGRVSSYASFDGKVYRIERIHMEDITSDLLYTSLSTGRQMQAPTRNRIDLTVQAEFRQVWPERIARDVR